MQQRLAREPSAQHIVVASRQVDAARERADVEAGAADDDRPLAAAVNVGDRVDRVTREACGGVAFGGIEEADEVVRRRRKLLSRRRRRADRHVAIDLARVRSDDLGVELSRQLDAEFRFAASRRTREDEDAVRHA